MYLRFLQHKLQPIVEQDTLQLHYMFFSATVLSVTTNELERLLERANEKENMFDFSDPEKNITLFSKKRKIVFGKFKKRHRTKLLLSL